MPLAVCLGIAALCLLAPLLYGMRYERKAKAVAEALLKDVSGRAVAVRQEIYRRGAESDVPELREEAQALIELCKYIRSCRPIMRDHLIKCCPLREWADSLETRLGQIPPVEEVSG